MELDKCCIHKDEGKLLDFFKALGNPSRMAIFNYFCRCRSEGTQTMNVNEVNTCCDVDLSVVSRHLSSLKRVGILSAEKKGKEVFYRLNEKDIAKFLRDLADEIENSNQLQSKDDSS